MQWAKKAVSRGKNQIGVLKTKSRLWRDLLFAVGIGYADITKIDRGLVLLNSLLKHPPGSFREGSSSSFNRHASEN